MSLAQRPAGPVRRSKPKLTATVKGLKVTTILSPTLFTPDIIPPEPQPAGELIIELDVGGKLKVSAILNGKGVRKALKLIAEHGPDNVVILIQGNIIPGDVPGSFVLDCPGLTCQPKVPKPAAPA
jgi:hypothetical protein